MTYTETQETEFTYFSDKEDKLIKEFLRKKGHTWGHNTVCGDCCGMYSDQYWVNGIGGEFPEEDKKELAKELERIGTHCSIYSYVIDADPTSGSGYEDRIEVGASR